MRKEPPIVYFRIELASIVNLNQLYSTDVATYQASYQAPRTNGVVRLENIGTVKLLTTIW